MQKRNKQYYLAVNAPSGNEYQNNLQHYHTKSIIGRGVHNNDLSLFLFTNTEHLLRPHRFYITVLVQFSFS